MTQLDSFETALLQALHEPAAVAERHLPEPIPIPQSPTRRRFSRVAAGIAASAAAAAALVAVGLSGPEPAFAVGTAADGDIVVTIHELSDAAGLEQALRDRGVDADVDYHAGDVCAPPPAPGADGSGVSDFYSGPEAGTGLTAPDLAGEPPAVLTRSGDDWTLRIPAESVLKETHFTLGTFPDGQLALGWQLPDGGDAVVFEGGCQIHGPAR